MYGARSLVGRRGLCFLQGGVVPEVEWQVKVVDVLVAGMCGA